MDPTLRLEGEVLSGKSIPCFCVANYKTLLLYMIVETETQITSFNERFNELQARTKAELVKCNKSVKNVDVKLSQALPSRIKRDYQKFIFNKRHRTQHNDLDEMFQDLCQFCWNCFEYEILWNIINANNCCQSLKKDMEHYVRDVEHFQQNTSTSNFIQHGRRLLKKSTPKGYRKLKTRYDTNPAGFMLSKLGHFTEDVWKRPELSECALHFAGATLGSVRIEWAFPEEFSYALIAFFSRGDGKELLQEHQIDVVMIDDTEVNQSVS